MKFGPKEVFSTFPSLHTKNENFLPSKKTVSSVPYDEPINIPAKSYTTTIITRKFVKKLKDAVFLKNLPKNNLSGLLKYIDDEAYFILEKDESILKKIVFTLFKIYEKIIILPDNFFKMLWNWTLIIFMIYCFFEIPFQISFDEETTGSSIYFDYFVCLLFLSDILLNFITGEFIKGFLETSPKIICKNYLRGLFSLDLIGFLYSIIQIQMMKCENPQTNNFVFFYRFLVFAKIPRFLNYSKLALNFFKIEHKYQNLIDIIKLLVYSLFLAHILACLWRLCAIFDSENNWLILYKIEHKKASSQYIYAFYWTITTMMTVGYGDIVPQNEYEALFTSVTIIFGCGLYAFNLNLIGMIVQNTFQKENQFRKDLRVINSFMDRKKVDAKLQRRVQEYLNFIWDEKNADNRDEEIAIINSLSETLREELFLESYGGNFLNHPMFVQNFSEESLRKIAKIIKEIKLLPGDEIFDV